MGPNVVCSLVEDGSQPIQLCLGIGVGNPRETVDAENNFSKASCQAPFFFFFFISRFHSSVPYPRTAGSRRGNVGTIRPWIEEPTLFSLSLSLPSFLSLSQIYPLNANIVSFSRIFVYYPEFISFISPVFLLFSFPRFFAFVPLFQKKVVEQSVIRFPRRYLFEGIKLC